MKYGEIFWKLIYLGIGLFISLVTFGFNLALIFLLLWADKFTIGRIVIQIQTGLEIATAALILTGIFYGPVFAFLFGLFLIPIIHGFFDMITWGFSKRPETPLEPFIPSFGSLIWGLTGAVAGFLIGINFFAIVIISLIFQYILRTIEGGMTVNAIAIFINFAINFSILYALNSFFNFV